MAEPGRRPEPMAPAGPCLAQAHDVALLDLDGVVYVGSSAVPHAQEALSLARSSCGMRSAYVTNNASRPPTVVAAHLVDLGIRAEPAEVITSAQAGARMLAELLGQGARVLAIGGPGVADALRERGLEPVASADDNPAAVLQGYGPQVGWAQLAEGSLAIARGLPWVATNTDRTIPTPRGRVLGNGALVAALQHASGVEPMVAGKPQPPLMRESVERSGARRPLVVGDRLDTDIEGAHRSGIPALLVLTGVTDWQDLFGAPVAQRPTHLGRDLRVLLEPVPDVRTEVTADSLEARCGRAVVRVPLLPEPTDHPTDDPGDGAEDVADGRVPWWVPAQWRAADGAGALAEPDLDVVRALVAAAWVVADSGAVVRALAQVDAAAY